MKKRNATIRTVPQYADLNLNGHIFGGWVLSQMDIAGGVATSRRSNGQVATVAVEGMTFHKPILVGDMICVYTDIIKEGTTSMTVNIEVIAERGPDAKRVKVTEGKYIYVAIDENARPRPIDGANTLKG